MAMRSSTNGRLSGKTALITGGGRGIGRAIAELFAIEGARVAVADFDEARAKEVAAALSMGTGEPLGLFVDVAQSASVERMMRNVTAAFDGLDILVNNAGIFSGMRLDACTDEEWRRLLDVNLTGVFFCTRSAAPIMREQRRGAIVNIASIAGKIPGILAGTAYCASKAGVISLTKSAAMDLASYGVRVNAVAPGIIDTDMTAHYTPDVITQIPLGRKGTPGEVAACALFLASDEASHVTGEILDVNAGMLMD